MCRDEILAQLTELFGDYIEQQRILSTIDKLDGNLDACIEALLANDGQGFQWKKVQEKPLSNLNNPENSNTLLPSDGPDRSTGATRKTNVSPSKSRREEMPASFASLLHKGSFATVQQPVVTNSNQQPSRAQRKSHPPPNLPSNFGTTVDMVAQGYRVMVLMRGAPGSGKTHLSRMLIDRTSAGDYRNHIFSADDYFMVNGVYKFQPDALDSAHRFTQSSVQAKAREGWSPIVVDNTNVRLWEMFPYVQIAAEHGYFLETLEPTTHWRNNSRSLAIRNTHGVPEPKIKSMLQNFEKLSSVRELYRSCKLEHMLSIPPKMRHYPILPQDLVIPPSDRPGDNGSHKSVPKWNEDWRDPLDGTVPKATNGPTTTLDLAAIPVPKPPRDGRQSILPAAAARQSAAMDEEEAGATGGGTLIEDFSWDFTDDWQKSEPNWKPYDTESVQFWGQPSSSQRSQSPPKASLLRAANETSTPKTKPMKNASSRTGPVLSKHRRGCANENASFSEICNLYPKVPESYLWDLFEKCSGDGDWVANLLLEEQKLENFESATTEEEENGGGCTSAGGAMALQVLECNCDGEPFGKETPRATMVVNNVMEKSSPLAAASLLSARDSMARDREGREAAKKKLETRFVLGNEHFSEHVQKIRLARGIVTADQPESGSSPAEEDLEVLDEGDAKGNDSEVTELRLGVELVEQLHSLFRDKHCPRSLDLDNLPPERTRVFMATEMAEQLYLLFLDSMYSYSEEEKLLNIRQDARMARLMETKEKYPALFKPQDPTAAPNLRDIIEMEQALAAYQKETNESWQKAGSAQDLAQQMSQQKLRELYPHVNGDDLLQILAAHNNHFDETVQVVNASIPADMLRQMQESEQLLKQRAENEKQKLLELFDSPVPSSPELTGEEAINFHLITAEECRNLAQHHLDLKNECHQKSRVAIQRGVPGLADYYSQIARLHRTKIDMYNSRASNCIMEVHKLKLNNSDVLDLHYLHSQEALRCLELFLAEHASQLLKSQQRFRTLYIITGRGLHSADGKPIIKQRVKVLLRAKNIRYTELNPGFLKIKLYNRDDLEQLMVME
ncbi:NEDD4-binding protein 2 [Anopheles cruzii]|uniref:NEDD4-binding protein 2 n=1 Tax=Anopheles cruzii TaxID=68878 RepID=UPI0022EC426C|nr:NEDD4-binding protein 2 [Anopheles cruzii]